MVQLSISEKGEIKAFLTLWKKGISNSSNYGSVVNHQNLPKTHFRCTRDLRNMGCWSPAFVKIRIFAPAQTLAKSLDLRAELLDLVLKILPNLLSSAYFKKTVKDQELFTLWCFYPFKLQSWFGIMRWSLAIRPNWWKFLVCCLLLGVWLRVDSSGKKQLPRSEAAMAEATDLGPITLQLDGHHLTFEDCVWLPGPSSLSSCMKETPIFCFLKSGIENVSLPMSCNKITRVPVQTFRRQLVVFSFSSFVLNFLQVAHRYH